MVLRLAPAQAIPPCLAHCCWLPPHRRRRRRRRHRRRRRRLTAAAGRPHFPLDHPPQPGRGRGRGCCPGSHLHQRQPRHPPAPGRRQQQRFRHLKSGSSAAQSIRTANMVPWGAVLAGVCSCPCRQTWVSRLVRTSSSSYLRCRHLVVVLARGNAAGGQQRGQHQGYSPPSHQVACSNIWPPEGVARGCCTQGHTQRRRVSHSKRLRRVRTQFLVAGMPGFSPAPASRVVQPPVSGARVGYLHLATSYRNAGSMCTDGMQSDALHAPAVHGAVQ
jgi:hypothetical protein